MKSTPAGANDASSGALARALLLGARIATLATLTADGAPFASLVTVAIDDNGAPLMLLSRLAAHTRNLARDARASLLIAEDQSTADPLTRARLSLLGSVVPVGKDAGARVRFLAHHPEAATYADFADFDFWRFEIAGGHLVAGFGRMAELRAADLHP